MCSAAFNASANPREKRTCSEFHRHNALAATIHARRYHFMRGDITLEKVFPITERQSFQFGLQIFHVFSLWHSNINGGPNGGGGIQGNAQSENFGSLVPIDHDASGNPLSESLQSGWRHLWNPRTIQLLAKCSFLRERHDRSPS
jgi:hypothetical protein